MASFDFINLLPRHFAVNCVKLKSYISKIQRTASSIGFICKSLFIVLFKNSVVIKILNFTCA